MYLVPLLIPIVNYATVVSGLIIVIIKDDTFPILDEMGQQTPQVSPSEANELIGYNRNKPPIFSLWRSTRVE